MLSPQTSSGSPETTPAPEDKESGWSLARFIMILIILAWALRSLVAAPFNIPSGSMEPTLYIGDYLIVGKWPYGYSRFSFPFGFPSFEGRVAGHMPKRGDVVVFRHPSENMDLIKRVIALPGDTVAVESGRVILNGKPLQRRPLGNYKLAISPNSPCQAMPPSTPRTIDLNGRGYCLYPAFEETLPGGPSFTVLDQVDNGPGDNFPATLVPAGHLFLMGDNRDDSLDSRFGADQGGVGMVPAENLIGRALVTFWSTDGSSSYLKPWTWFSALRGDRIGNGYSGEAE